MSSDTFKLSDVHDLEQREQVTDFASSMHSFSGNSFFTGTDYYKSNVGGTVRDRLWTDYLVLRVADILNKKTKASVNVVEILYKRLELSKLFSVSARDSIDLVLALDSTFFSVNVQKSMVVQVLSLQPPFHNVLRSNGYENSSEELFVLCYSFWSLYWMDAATGVVSCQQRVLQTGEYYENYEDDVMKGLILCAMKTGDEFVKLFR